MFVCVRLFRALFLCVLIAAGLTPAHAAEFTGFYAGLHAGKASTETDIKDGGTNITNPPYGAFACGPALTGNYCNTPLSLDTDDWFWGGQIGYNQQIGIFVFGVEGDLGRLDQKDARLLNRPFGDQDVASVSFDWYGAITGRAGIVLAQQSFIYLKGGWAVADVSTTAADLDNGQIYQGSYTESDKSEKGWVIGGGVEYALSTLISLKAEYQYFDFGSERSTSSDGDVYKHDVDMHSVRVGVNFHLPGSGLY